jgi:hypothetical protein
VVLTHFICKLNKVIANEYHNNCFFKYKINIRIRYVSIKTIKIQNLTPKYISGQNNTKNNNKYRN